MSAPQTSITPLISPSAQDGIEYMRLYENIRTTAMSSMMASNNLIFTVGIEGLTSLSALVDCIAYAVAVEVTLEIKGHSKLQSIARDAGSAGAGIISGYVE